MKKNLLFYSLILLGALTACSTVRPTWEENFNGKELDTTVWSKIPRGHSDWQHYHSSCDSCFAMRHGKLVLRGLRNSCEPGDSAPYLTGGVYTHSKKTFLPGRMEIRARLGDARGAWPAIWMLPQDAGWPMGGEIDIMERLNSDTIAYQTVHSNYTVNLHHEWPRKGGTNRINPHKFNTYAVEVFPDSLVFSINGRHTLTYPRLPQKEEEGQYEFYRHPFYLLIDMQLGGSWVGAVNPADLPVEMEIDWVRYYKRP